MINKQSILKGIFSGLLFIAGTISAQITYTFTTAGATGRYGPTQGQLNTAYASTNLNGLVVSNSGIQTWTVPVSGPYRISARGACGGNMNSQEFGTGATMIGDVNLVAGEVLKIVVGQRGIDCPNVWEGAGGGGGSFVVKNVGNIALVVAAGGSGGDGYGNYSTRQKPGGSSATGNANLAGVANSPLASAAGGGFIYNGQTGNVGTGGFSFLNGANGGTCNYGNALCHGGFGGGGAGDYYSMGGAGGGYQGGNTQGGYSNTDGLTSAYSYNAGTNQLNTSGFTTTNIALKADGQVLITSLYGLTISQTSTILCNGLSTAALSATINGGTGPYSYTWSPSGGNATTASSLPAGVYTLTARDANTNTTSATYTVTQPSALTTSISAQTNVSCFGGSNGAGTILVSGGTPGYSYTWSPSGGNSASASGLTAGNYSVAIKDANNCTTSRTFTITQPAAIALTASANNPTLCSGGGVILTASGANTYVWNNGIPNGLAFVPNSSGTFIVTGTNTLTSCTGTAAVSVTVYPTPLISVAGGTICSGNSFVINASGTTSYIYSSGSATVSPLNTTAYTVIGVSLQNCLSAASTITVSVNASPTISVNSATICNGGSANLTANGANTYTWVAGPSSASYSVNPSSTAVYTVNGTSNACVNSTTVMVSVNPLPLVSVNSGSICSGNNFTIVPSGAATYTFSGGSAIVNPNANTSYSVTGTSSLGCTSTLVAISFVNVNTNPTVTISSGSICSGQSFTFSPSGASSYSYVSGAAIVSPSVTTSYTVIGTSPEGCLSDSSAIVTVIVHATPTISINTTSVCAGQNLTLSPSGAITYTYSSGSPIVNPTINTTYTISGTSLEGCVSNPDLVITVNVVQLPTVLFVASNSLACVDGNAIVLTGLPIGGVYAGIGVSGNSFSASANGTYTPSYTYTDAITGCVNSATLEIAATECTGINKLDTKTVSINLYPNPNNGLFTIETNTIDEKAISVFDMSGRIIFSEISKDTTISMNLSEIAKGLYYVSVKTNSGSSVIKVVKD